MKTVQIISSVLISGIGLILYRRYGKKEEAIENKTDLQPQDIPVSGPPINTGNGDISGVPARAGFAGFQWRLGTNSSLYYEYLADFKD